MNNNSEEGSGGGAAALAVRRRNGVFGMRSSTSWLLWSLLGSSSLSAQVDHRPFDRLLGQYVVNGLVDYSAFQTAPEFAGYLDQLARVEPDSLGRADQLALWINAYNAYTIALINRHGERKSIRNINKSLGLVKGYGPWQEKLAVVGGKEYSLDEIEQRIIRPRFSEPRIHFALVCAALGCPNLRSEAYHGERLEAQLEEQAAAFLARTPTKNRVDLATRTVYLSRVFEFRDYEKDFGGTKEAIGRFVARYYPVGSAERDLLESGAFRLEYTGYDWRLNGLKPQGPAAGSNRG